MTDLTKALEAAREFVAEADDYDIDPNGGARPIDGLFVDICRAFVALAKEREWRPIETAPRDGTQILACAQLSEHLTAAIISSQGHLPDLSIVKWDDREKDFIAMADGYMSIKSQGDNWTTYHEPYVTHWMPLPIPPATLKDTGQ